MKLQEQRMLEEDDAVEEKDEGVEIDSDDDDLKEDKILRGGMGYEGTQQRAHLDVRSPFMTLGRP